MLFQVGLTILGFAAFWMDPSTGERLGFGIIMVLSMLAHDITAVNYMPICEERVFMDYMSLVCMLFAAVCLLETCLVLFVHHQAHASWADTLLPHRNCCSRWRQRAM